MLANLRRSFLLSLVFLAFLGLAYGYAGTGVSMLFFRHQAEGSFVKDGQAVVGSAEIEQAWAGPKWFQGRPDASLLTNKPNQVVVSGTQQWGPRSKALERFVAAQASRLEKEGIKPTNSLVTNSGSLVDPDISPAGAYAQVDAVAKANHLPVATVRALVASHVHGRELGFLGAPYVNVLELNMALYSFEHHLHR
ncbi:MAG: potassium-transporting ATPase subunit C [Actinomycetota bacterium]|jgi:K+-transporting ATPase ATPase C chain|nr:potassium-transporting ATPase subunit C [Actinomycetota bacterium]